MLTKKDIIAIKGIVREEISVAVAPLATKDDLARQESRLIKHEVKSDANIARLERKMDKGFSEIKKAIKKEHKIGVEDFCYLEKEGHTTKQRIERVERHLGLAPMAV